MFLDISILQKNVKASGYNLEIPDAVASSEQVNVTNVEYIPDAYEAILQFFDMMTYRKNERR